MASLVLDIDETMIHAIVSEVPIPEYEPVKATRNGGNGGGGGGGEGNRDLYPRPVVTNGSLPKVSAASATGQPNGYSWRVTGPRGHVVSKNGVTQLVGEVRPADFKFIMGRQHYYIFVRPGLEEFLRVAFRVFKNVGIWTAADCSYAKLIVKHIMTEEQIRRYLRFIVTRQFCESDHLGFFKPLAKISKYYPNFEVGKTLMLDNNEAVMRANLEYGIKAVNYNEQNLVTDTYLLRLTEMIKHVSHYRYYDRFVHAVNTSFAGAYQASLSPEDLAQRPIQPRDWQWSRPLGGNGPINRPPLPGPGNGTKNGVCASSGGVVLANANSNARKVVTPTHNTRGALPVMIPIMAGGGYGRRRGAGGYLSS